MNDYQKILYYICPIPDFLYKYLELDSMKRLKDISLFCGMKYASSKMYHFNFDISRYEHSLAVALITWRLTQDKAQTIAALFHDISTPVFSHVIDYMNGDYVNQESTEDKTKEVLISTNNIMEYLEEDGLTLDDVSDFKIYPVVDLPRPCLCADRLEGIISGGMGWSGKTTYDFACELLDSMYLTKNENGIDEICVASKEVGERMVVVNDHLNKLTHSDEDIYMMILLSDIVKLTINEGMIIYDDLYRLTEPQFIDIIESNLDNYELADLWSLFTCVEPPILGNGIEVKDRCLNPLVLGKRLK